jgi:hypothetical protein
VTVKRAFCTLRVLFSVTQCRQSTDLTGTSDILCSESVLSAGRRLSDLADDGCTYYYNVTATSNGGIRSLDSLAGGCQFEKDIQPPRTLRINSMSVSQTPQPHERRANNMSSGSVCQSCETVCSEHSAVSSCQMPSTSRGDVCSSVPISDPRQSDAACALTQSCDMSASRSSSHAFDSEIPPRASKRSNKADCNREVNWRRHSLGDIYRKLYCAVDGFVSQRWFSRSLSKFMGSSSETEDCIQGDDAAADKSHNSVTASKSLNYPLASTSSCSTSSSKTDGDETPSIGALTINVTSSEKPPPVPPRTAAQDARNVCHSEIFVQDQKCVNQPYESRLLDHKLDLDKKNRNVTSELAWRHTVLLCCPEKVSPDTKAASKLDNGNCSNFGRQNFETVPVNDKSRRLMRNLTFMRSHSVGNQLCKSNQSCFDCCSVCYLPLSVCFCKSSNNKEAEGPTAATKSGGSPSVDGTSAESMKYVEPLSYDQLKLHQSSVSSLGHRDLSSSTSSLDQLGPPPPVPCSDNRVKLMTSNTCTCTTASETAASVEPVCRNNNFARGEYAVDVKNSSDSGISRAATGTVRLSDHRKVSRRPNLTVNTSYASPHTDTSRTFTGEECKIIIN